MNDSERRTMRWRYTGIIATTLIAIAVIYLFFCWGRPTIVLLVRHADRQNEKDAISQSGTARVQELIHVLEKSSISVIYTSEAARTQQPAAPITNLLGITPVGVVASDMAGLVNTIVAMTSSSRTISSRLSISSSTSERMKKSLGLSSSCNL